MSAREDYPILVAWLRGMPVTGINGDGMEIAVIQALDEIDRLRSAMRVLGKAARDGSDMLHFLRLSEGVQEWHEDRLDDIDRCIAAIESAPA